MEKYTQWVGIAAGILTSSSLLPQLIKILRTKKTEDLSLFFLVTLLVGLALWVVYGFMRDDVPIIVTNIFAISVNLMMIGLRIRYKRTSSR